MTLTDGHTSGYELPDGSGFWKCKCGEVFPASLMWIEHSRRAVEAVTLTRPSDPVLDFIYDPAVLSLITDGQEHWPWSRLSASRIDKIGYRLIVLRCAQIGVEPPTRTEAREWR